MAMGIKVFINVILVVIMTSLTDARSVPESAANSTMLRKSVEVVVVVDRYAHGQWRQWQQGAGDEEDRERMTQEAITQFVHATFCSANLICKGLEAYNVSLDLRIDHIRVVTDEDVVPPMADGVSVMNENASWGFHQWLIRNGIEFDHALFLTGLDLSAEDSNGHEGYAYMNTMCRSDSVSVVENIINGIPAVVVAHEVSHSLSAKHDGGRNNRCNSTSGYIMNANNIGTSPNHWNYSTCSGHDIANKLQLLQDSYDCLSEDSTRSPPVEPPYLGQLYSGDQLCQMSHGNHSYVCRHLYNRPQSRSVCQILWCLVNQTYCAGVAPVDGLPCGAGKRCLAGQCMPFDDVPEEVTDECFAGDKPGFAWRNQTCGEVVSSYTSLCLDEWYQDFCCQTCLGFYTGNDACPYGDAFSSCSRWHCSTRWARQCCQTCPR